MYFQYAFQGEPRISKVKKLNPKFREYPKVCGNCEYAVSDDGTVGLVGFVWCHRFAWIIKANLEGCEEYVARAG